MNIVSCSEERRKAVPYITEHHSEERRKAVPYITEHHRYIGIQIQCEGAGRTLIERDLCQVVLVHELFMVVEVAHRMRKYITGDHGPHDDRRHRE
ncbi:uncharacterized protein [Triticum aestivum]|uniref:uncharacterized protein isoform X5 n=1 Tax=Triticum aestivum TaxID=4565 RepID=UPI001D018A7C|nr:uncharacterized protein LOC123057568 isoform X5 [Triticum aestivum]